jgi:hypothetical protein
LVGLSAAASEPIRAVGVLGLVRGLCGQTGDPHIASLLRIVVKQSFEASDLPSTTSEIGGRVPTPGL